MTTKQATRKLELMRQHNAAMAEAIGRLETECDAAADLANAMEFGTYNETMAALRAYREIVPNEHQPA